MDYPTHNSLIVIQENFDYRLARILLLCYNLENSSESDTEVTFTNPNLANIRSLTSNNGAAIPFPNFTPSFNGNATCRSRSTGKESTIFIASKQLAYFICVS